MVALAIFPKARCLLRLNAAFKNKQGRKRGEMQLWRLAKQKLGGGGGADTAPPHVIKTAVLLSCCLRSFDFRLSFSRLPLTQANTRQAAQLVTGQGRVGASKAFTTRKHAGPLQRKEEHSRAVSLLPFLSSPPRYRVPCLFLQRWSRRPIWTGWAPAHICSLSASPLGTCRH